MESPDSIVDPTHDTADAVVAADADAPSAEVSASDVIDLTDAEPEVVAEQQEAQADSDDAAIDLTSSEDAPTWAPEADASTDAPSVDALEQQLGSLQGAMDKLQSGDLDGAERTIEVLEQQIADLRS